MRVVSTPLAALCGAFFTWYSLEQKTLHQLQLRPPSVELAPTKSTDTDESDEAFDISLLRQELNKKAYRIQELEAALENGANIRNSESTATDPFVDLFDAARRSTLVLFDASNFVWNSAVAQIWPWPVDSSKGAITTFPDFQPHLERAQKTVEERLSPFILKGQAFAAELWGEVPVEVGQALGQISELLVQAVEMFLERYPQHKASFSGVKPGVLFIALLCMIYLFFWELYMSWRMLLFILTLPCKVCGCCCRCFCRRSGSAIAADKTCDDVSDKNGSAETPAENPGATPTSRRQSRRNSLKQQGSA
eukprot:TRINITY_DN7264_c0_g4_i2.p1 TRINITY_DN7264_c0_g4~~TRINITY_DN7264_c0_g4_i2.p1  ORF type:complete len:307 (+),score=48.80 TRINITY_DN7264_c0_g4_i2:143-1063(+)